MSRREVLQEGNWLIKTKQVKSIEEEKYLNLWNNFYFFQVNDAGNGNYRCEKCSKEFPNFKWRVLIHVSKVIFYVKCR